MAIRYASTYHDEVQRLVDVEEVHKEDKNKPKWPSFKEAEGRKHRMVRADEGKKNFHCVMCGMMRLYHRVPGSC